MPPRVLIPALLVVALALVAPLVESFSLPHLNLPSLPDLTPDIEPNHTLPLLGTPPSTAPVASVEPSPGTRLSSVPSG